MDYDEFLRAVLGYVANDELSPGAKFELNQLPFWSKVKHPTTFGKRFLEYVSDGNIPELEALPKSTDNHQWYMKK